MPCNSDYMNPTGRELEFRRVANLLMYVRSQLNRGISGDLIRTSENAYADLDFTAELCEEMSKLKKHPDLFDKIVYNARDFMSRELATWWEMHQKADAERMQREEAQAKDKALRESAEAKLTSEELAAIKRDKG